MYLFTLHAVKEKKGKECHTLSEISIKSPL